MFTKGVFVHAKQSQEREQFAVDRLRAGVQLERHGARQFLI